MRQFNAWHWIAAAISLLGLLGFAFTGITLNHAREIVAHPVIRQQRMVLPAPLQAELAAMPPGRRDALPGGVAGWLDRQFAVAVAAREAEWSAEEIYFTLKRPGGDGWIRIDRRSGAVTYEDTWRGWIAYLNDLHKGRNTGGAWRWFIDLFAGACLVFCLTGFGLLWLKAPARPATWPLIGIGTVVPLLLAAYFLH